MKPLKDGPACGLTKKIFLEGIANGETMSSIEKAWGMKYNTIHNWVKKWELKGITPEKARKLLEQTGEEPAQPKGIITKPGVSGVGTAAGPSNYKPQADLPEAVIKANPKLIDEYVLNDIEWFTPELVIAGPVVSLNKSGFTFNDTATAKLGLQVDDALMIGVAGNKLVLKKDSRGVKVKQATSHSVTVQSRKLASWLTKKNIKRRRYPLRSENGMYFIEVEVSGR
ncbi:hypothetical protein [Paenibacillus alkalitolerans]|uniref:hypothetical protein n=1 Tax=Paenibacillus alkalitolerans TaxID=2799335 RepID=UPI001F29202F|nr:hypothetical protein [Paenibacillus alkalitolerans]